MDTSEDNGQLSAGERAELRQRGRQAVRQRRADRGLPPHCVDQVTWAKLAELLHRP